VDALTICALNYLPFAKVLAESFLEFHPESKFYLLLVDGGTKPDLGPGYPGIRVITPSDLDLDQEEFERMTIYYDVTELSTALKPLGMKYLLDQGSEIAIYLDPDIQVFSELVEIPKHLLSASIALTPHTLHEIPRDGLRPSDFDIMASGTFNLGFIAIRKCDESYEFLRWWNERLIFDCIADIENNLFTDQRWIDFVPSYFSFSVIRNYGYNIAYWNLHERKISEFESKLFANGEPLRFFHFSGYKPDNPWVLSKHVADRPRVLMSAQPLVKELADGYGELAKSHSSAAGIVAQYGFSEFKGQIKLTPEIRRRYRKEVISAIKNGAEFPPFGSDPESVILDWLNRQIPESGRLNVALYDVWKGRPDLQLAFPFATTTQAPNLVKWAHKFGVNEGVINEAAIKIFSESLKDSKKVLISKELGLNIYGYFKGEFGVAQSGRLLARASKATGLKVSIINNSETVSRQLEDFETDEHDSFYGVTIGVVNADQFSVWRNSLPAQLNANSKFVGVWAWEVESFPKSSQAACEIVDEIWAVSNFVKDAISPHTDTPIFVVPTPIIAPPINEILDRKAIGLVDGQDYNLFVFDYFSVFRRKNPLDLVSAHIMAFPKQEGPTLVIKAINGEFHRNQQDQLKSAVSGRSDIIITDAYLSREQLHSLVNECQAYISLHRSEGYGLTIAEAMSLGKPVIATAYSGNMDFMNPDNSILVPFEYVDIGKDAFPYPKDSRWAQPDIEFAAKAMRELSADESLRTRIGDRARNDVTSEFTIERAAEFIQGRVKNLSKRSLLLKYSRKLRKLIS
jgi:glycosyltransferase involved in cell wall biosynthesis